MNTKLMAATNCFGENKSTVDVRANPQQWNLLNGLQNLAEGTNEEIHQLHVKLDEILRQLSQLKR